MNLLHLLILFVAFGFGLYLINRFVPMEPTVKTMMNVVIIFLLFLWMIALLFPEFGAITVGTRHY